jgi:predicted nucleotidyltransferase
MIDAKEQDIILIAKTIRKHIPDCEIRVFGSRIKGTARPYSDIDIAIVAENLISPLTLERIKEEFAQSDIPCRVDILDFKAISDSFRKVIEDGYEVI